MGVLAVSLLFDSRLPWGKSFLLRVNESEEYHAAC